MRAAHVYWRAPGRPVATALPAWKHCREFDTDVLDGAAVVLLASSRGVSDEAPKPRSRGNARGSFSSPTACRDQLPVRIQEIPQSHHAFVRHKGHAISLRHFSTACAAPSSGRSLDCHPPVPRVRSHERASCPCPSCPAPVRYLAALGAGSDRLSHGAVEVCAWSDIA